MCACPRRKEEKTDEKETRTSGGIRQQNQSIVQIKQSAVHIEKGKDQILTSFRKKSPTSKREGARAPVHVGDECWPAIAVGSNHMLFKRAPSKRREAERVLVRLVVWHICKSLKAPPMHSRRWVSRLRGSRSLL
ncbi:hypothetical protein GK1579 [Geobacillus kaustophilus HTA426]|uniref:Uncharacterized protein n=1 Tax=Geobacillus kaustophilus (strain HTA426) TaxID=235909 RepID=Q5KZM2_GEOKA|nr:hypothetical protein GK1579 [Geobacillus kaustophilus HTA426]